MQLKDFIDKIEQLPTPDPVVQRIISIASDPNASAKDLADAMRLDPSLTAKVLRLVNSAYYGLPRKIAKLNEAIMILGFKTVRNLALSVFTYKSLTGSRNSKIDQLALWKHFVGVAVAGELLAHMLNYPNREEVFVAGLLHDLGKLALDYISPESFAAVAKVTKTLQISFFEAEAKLNIPQHTATGSLLAERWNLPEIVTQPISGHHDVKSFSDSVYADVVSMVHIADFVVNTFKFGDSYTYGGLKLSPDALNVLAIKPKMLTNYVDKLKERLATAEEFLSIDKAVEV
ncbi:HDOD domain-containing protein [Pseudothermotoga thermarum]|uniref:Putative signal transduction protein n=1 Tax=Pseudothermotoga thermarum DSM 5069 TaxID=688269 RepID=F7YYL6_9THEM|nr:HDOD domain-containing protein [Pseudothermotoga thermarum]AEH51048.1 putative signal transduction protein [Pseudothermotoga thermarum DSM 5069]